MCLAPHRVGIARMISVAVLLLLYSLYNPAEPLLVPSPG